MKIAIVGGALQGVEVAYLARKAGIETVLLDRRSSMPACRMCDSFRQVDVTDLDSLEHAASDVDIIFPALESHSALSGLDTYARRHEVPFVHDPKAYAISASKIESHRFFQEIGVPVPAVWPDCQFPVIAKPSAGSGSKGIRLFSSREALQQVVSQDPKANGWIVQSFLPGPTYSIEVLRTDKRLSALQITDLHMDAGFDCKRVSAPSALSAQLQAQLMDLSLGMAEALELEGIMDVEMVLHNGNLKVLEIDARFPSQTPITVYWSREVNMVEVLVKTGIGDDASNLMVLPRPDRGVVFEHIRVTPGTLEVAGEHVMAGSAGLQVHQDFFGANEAITDYAEGRDSWVATLICSDIDLADAWARRKAVVSDICRRFKINRYVDQSPPAFAEEGTT